MSMKGKVTVILRTSSAARAPVYAHLHTLGVVLVLVHPTEPSQEFDGIFHHWLAAETNDPSSLRPLLTTFLEERNLKADAILSFDEYAVYVAAVLSKTMDIGNCIPLPPDDIRCTSIKSEFRVFCAKHGIFSPAMKLLRRPENQLLSLCTSEEDAGLRFVDYMVKQMVPLQFPVVLKPSPGAGSALARLCFTIDEVCSHARYMWHSFDSHPAAKHFKALTEGLSASAEANVGVTREQANDFGVISTSPPQELQYSPMEILAEEYISGQEVDIDCVVEHGRLVFCSISDNFEPQPPYFAEVGGLCPSALGEEPQRALRDLLLHYISVYGTVLHGVLHFEAKYDFNRCKPYVIEVNLRMGSAETDSMIRTAYRGFQLGEALVRCALGLPVLEQLRRHYPECFSRDEHVCYPDKNCAFKAMPWEDIFPPSFCSSTSYGASASRHPLDLRLDTALGGPLMGFFPISAIAASVNIYPGYEGILERVEVPLHDPNLVAYSVAARKGDYVAPPPRHAGLLCWMVARGNMVAEARQNIDNLKQGFLLEIAPLES